MSRIRRVMGSAAGAMDRALLAAMNVRRDKRSVQAEGLGHDARIALLDSVARTYGDPSLISDPALFFPRGSAISPKLREVRSLVFDAQWPSAFEPFLPDVRDKYLAEIENRTARARLYLGRAGRPAVIAIHGYLGGQWLLEERLWPIPWLLRRGLDVALPVLPFHALRGGERTRPPRFPSSDPRFTNEGFRQAVIDIVGLARWLRARGAPFVGVMGMSLGGYTSSLLATVSDEFDFVVPIIPLASIADFAREQGRLGAGDEVSAQHRALERANWVVSPMARPLRIPKSRALVVAALYDRITPRSHAERIAAHFDCAMVTTLGAHVIPFGRAEGFRSIASMLEREGVLPSRSR